MSEIIISNNAEPDTPASGKSVIYIDSTSKKLSTKDDAGNVTDYSTGGGSDTKQVLISANDTTEGYINGKLVAGTNITFTENNDGGNETLTIDATDTDTDALADLTDVTINSPSNGEVLTYNSGTGVWENQAASGGSFSGPVSSTDNAIVRFDGTSGDTAQDSQVTIEDTGEVNFVAGSVSSPSIRLAGATDGLYFTTGRIRYTNAGIDRVRLEASGIVGRNLIVETGTGKGGIIFENDANTGLQYVTNDDFKIQTNNNDNIRVTNTATIFNIQPNMPSLPTSSAGLNAGDLWNNSGVVNIV